MPTSRPRPACWPATTRRRRGCGSNARDVRDGEALLAFGARMPPHNGPVINLSASGDLTEAAANLFAALRSLDAAGATGHRRHADPRGGIGRGHQRPPEEGCDAAMTSDAKPTRLSPELIDRLRAIVGPSTR